MIQPTTMAVGSHANRSTPGLRCGIPHFVQPPKSCERPSASPAAAMSPIAPQNPFVVAASGNCASQMRSPATATPRRVKRARTSGGPSQPREAVSSRRTVVASRSSSLRLRKNATFVTSSPSFPGKIPSGATSVTGWRLRSEVAAARVERAGIECFAKGFHRRLAVSREDVLHDVHARVVVEGHVDVLARDEVERRADARGALDSQAEALVPRGERAERRGEDRARAFFGITEEAPGPRTRANPAGRLLEQLLGGVFELGGHQVQE